MNIGVFLPNWIGDAAMATPALRALRKRFPAPARLVGIVRPYIAEVLAGAPWCDEMLLYEPRAARRELSSWSLVATMRRRRLDVCVLLTNSLRTAALAWLGGARRRVGYNCEGRGVFLTDRLRPPPNRRRMSISTVDYYLELAYALGCPPESHRLELATLPQDEQAADRIWDKLSLSDAPRVAVFNTGGAYGDAKHWPQEHFAALARRVADELEMAVLLICGPNERAAAAEIAQRANHPRVRTLAEETLSVGLSKACVRRAEVMVTTDSGPRHFAAAFQVPTIALFGPTDPVLSANYNAHETRLRLPLACSPCMARTCPLQHHRCLRDLTPDQAFSAVAAILQGRPSRELIGA